MNETTNEMRICPKGLKLNPNTKIVNAINKRLVVCEGFCPCVADSIGKEEYRCPCKKAREEQECCCQLYVKE